MTQVALFEEPDVLDELWAEVLRLVPEWDQIRKKTGYAPLIALRLYLALHRDSQLTDAEEAVLRKKKR